MQKRNQTIYWIITVLMFVPGGIGGAVELFTNGPASIVQIMLTLGYPLYLMKILGLAKVLGSVAILYGKFPRLKEWAYAGFAFDYLGAIASHILTGDTAHAIFPFLFFVVMMVTYWLWHKNSLKSAPAKG
jgi:uncharacterized membrane protein